MAFPQCERRNVAVAKLCTWTTSHTNYTSTYSVAGCHSLHQENLTLETKRKQELWFSFILLLIVHLNITVISGNNFINDQNLKVTEFVQEISSIIDTKISTWQISSPLQGVNVRYVFSNHIFEWTLSHRWSIWKASLRNDSENADRNGNVKWRSSRRLHRAWVL